MRVYSDGGLGFPRLILNKKRMWIIPRKDRMILDISKCVMMSLSRQAAEYLCGVSLVKPAELFVCFGRCKARRIVHLPVF